MIKKLFPTNLPCIRKEGSFIPKDINLSIKGLVGNDMQYLILYWSLKEKGTDKDLAKRLLKLCQKSRTSEWRRVKRLSKLGLL